MRFADIKGNEELVRVLRSMVDDGHVPHALMLYENPGSGALGIAVAFLQYLNCRNRGAGDSCGVCPSCRQMEKLVHPDVHYVFPVNTGDVIKDKNPISEAGLGAFRELFLNDPCFTEQELYDALGIESKSGNISVAQARDMISKMYLTPLSGGYKAVVMFLPERMNEAAANKLLKLLEEPPEYTVFILVTQNPRDVLTTVFSRCQGMRVLPSGRGDVVDNRTPEEITALFDALLKSLLEKDLYSMLETADALAALKSREKQKQFCTYAAEQIRKIFLISKGLEDIAYAPMQKADVLRGAGGVLDSRFCLNASAAIDNAAMMIGRNVSAKIVFADLMNRFFVYMK